MTFTARRPSPRDVMDAVQSSVHIIDCGSVAPGVVRLTVGVGQARLAAAVLLQAGYDVARDGDQIVTVTAA